MSRLIPNTDPVSGDLCRCPIELEVPVVIVDNGQDCFWFNEAMDRPAAERLIFAMMQGNDCLAYRVTLRLVLPAATAARAETADLGSLHCDPIRVPLRAG